jgi:hypothetical protein
MGTTALMLNAAWLRNWLYHGQHLFFGIVGLRSLLRGDQAAITYSHELTASVDASAFLLICIAFPLIALVLTRLGAPSLGDAAAGHGPGGGPPGPERAPDLPDSGQLAGITDDDAASAVSLLSLHEPGPGIEQDRLMAG